MGEPKDRAWGICQERGGVVVRVWQHEGSLGRDSVGRNEQKNSNKHL